MKLNRPILFSAVCMMLPLQVQAQEMYITASPNNYVVGYQAENGNRQIIEYVPSGQTVQQWSEMLTNQVISGDSALSAEQFAEQFKAGIEQSCPQGSFKVGRSGKENGYPFIFGMLHCPKNPSTGQGELAIVKATRGEKALYISQKAWRGEVVENFEKKLHGEISHWSSLLSKFRICNDSQTGKDCASLKSALGI